MIDFLEKRFQLSARGTNPRTELLGGLTTFFAMAYIIVVNPAILQFAGLPVGASTVATILTAIFGCTLMGLLANVPVAVAPYMGENAFIAFGMASMGVGWQLRLGAVFISGLAFLLLSLGPVRAWLANSISRSMKYSFAVGIGLFLAFIGLYESGIVTSGAAGMPAQALVDQATHILRAPPVPVKLGDLHDATVLLSILGFVAIAVLHFHKIKGSILWGMIGTAVVGILLGHGAPPKAIAAMPFVGEYSLQDIAFKLDIAGAVRLSFFPVLLTLFLMSFLDTLGTLVGVASAAGLVNEKGDLENIEKPMIVDSLSCVFSSLVGTSTSGAFIESAAGIKEGARTGLSALVVAFLFLVSLFLMPLFTPLQQLRYAYSPAMVFVGLSMLPSIKHVDLDDVCEAVPCFATIAMMLFTYNIANGLTAGLILAPLFKLLCGRARELTSGSVVLAILCLVYYFFGLPH